MVIWQCTCLHRFHQSSLQEWRHQSASGLCIFAQGATAATDVLINFLPRTFELAKHEAIYPVVIDIYNPMPIHLRTATSGFLPGLLLYIISDWIEPTPLALQA